MKKITRVGALDRYTAIMKEMFRLKSFKATALVKRFKVTNNIKSALVKMGLIEKINRFYKWVGPEPNAELVESLSKFLKTAHAEKKWKVTGQLGLALPISQPSENGSAITEQDAIKFLKATGRYRIYKTTEVEV